MGVDLFFVLSGFLITGRLLDCKGKSIGGYFGHFYARRARRILPPYLFLLSVTAILFGAAWARSWYIYLFFANFAPVFGVQLPLTLCVLWSLGVEEQFYLLWPFAVRFLSEEAIAWLAATLVIAAPLLRGYCTPFFPNESFIYSLTPFRMDTLAAGALIAILWRKRQDAIRRLGHFGPVFSLAAFGVIALFARNSQFTTTSNTRESNVLIFEMTLIISVGVILWALSGKGTGVLMLAPVRYLGRISYTVYLIHLTVFAVVSEHLHAKAGSILATIAITLLCASVSWFLLEEPILRSQPEKMLTRVDEVSEQPIAVG